MQANTLQPYVRRFGLGHVFGQSLSRFKLCCRYCRTPLTVCGCESVKDTGAKNDDEANLLRDFLEVVPAQQRSSVRELASFAFPMRRFASSGTDSSDRLQRSC